MSLARIVVSELGTVLRITYVVVAELLPRLRGALGLKNRAINIDQNSFEFYTKTKEEKFVRHFAFIAVN